MARAWRIGAFRIKKNPFENDWSIGALEENILISISARENNPSYNHWSIGALEDKN